MSAHRVTALIYDGLATFEFGLVSEVFGLHRPEIDASWYDFSVASADASPVRALGGVTITAPAGLRALASADTIVVPGWRDIERPPPDAVLSALRRAHARGARLLSICSGAFALAATGLLDGRRATTHWRYADLLAELYPRVTVEPDVLYIDEGSIITSAGSAAGLDACLHVVRKDFGAEVANSVARRLVVQPHREGGQRQFVTPAEPAQHLDSLAPVLEWATENLRDELTVASLARRAAVAPRTLNRYFVDQLGITPHRWIVRQRLLRAQELLETTRLSVEAVASESGFATAATLRHHFAAAFGTSPTAYRNHFGRLPQS